MNHDFLIILLLVILILCILCQFYAINEGLDNADGIDIQSNGVIPDGYYKISSTKIKKIPFGYITNNDKTELILKPYNTNNYDVLYHDEEQTIISQGGVYGAGIDSTMVLDSCGNKVLIPYSKTQGFPIYYKPGTYKYGANTYVPNYEDSVYLSKMNNIKPLPISSNPYEKSLNIQNANISNKTGKKIVYVKPVFVSLPNYLPKNDNTIFSSTTTGMETTSVYSTK
jgi:hypothetical protein